MQTDGNAYIAANDEFSGSLHDPESQIKKVGRTCIATKTHDRDDNYDNDNSVLFLL